MSRTATPGTAAGALLWILAAAAAPKTAGYRPC
jgi:hypothetical protein